MARTSKGVKIKNAGVELGDFTTIDLLGGLSGADEGTSTVGVTASAGSGSQLQATETPNGTITVFTFAAATAQPSVIVADNTYLRATTKAGTVNWTWNAGAKQATLTIAPQDEIFALP